MLGVPLRSVLYLPSKNSSAGVADGRGFTLRANPELDHEPHEVREYADGAAFADENALDLSLHAEATKRLSELMSADRERLSEALHTFQAMRQQAEVSCSASLARATREPFDCYWNDNGCGYHCLDARFLAPPRPFPSSAHHAQFEADGPIQWLARWRASARAGLYRAAVQPPPLGSRIPPQLFQTAHTAEAALASYEHLMQTWWKRNPQMHYHLLEERDCVDFVQRFGSAEQVRAYQHVRLGTMRGDLCRAHLLLRLGGVYADADLENLRPLWPLIPPNASAVKVTYNPEKRLRHWPYTILAFSANHPILQRHVADSSREILRQQKLFAEGGTRVACQSHKECMLQISGPGAFQNALSSLAKLCPLLLSNSARLDWPCDAGAAVEPQWRGIYVLSSLDVVQHHSFNSSLYPPESYHLQAFDPRRVFAFDTPTAFAAGSSASASTRFYWLHIPKTGSTFLATLVDVACPVALASLYNGVAMLPGALFKRLRREQKELLPECVINPPEEHFYSTSHGQLDLVLRRVCALSPFFTTDSDIGLPVRSVPAENEGWFEDRPWTNDSLQSDGSCLGIGHVPRGASGPFDFTSVVVLVREPLARLISAYLYAEHDLTMGHPAEMQIVHELQPAQRVIFYALHACSMQTRVLSGAVGKRAWGVWDPPAAFPFGVPADGCTAAGLKAGLGRVRQLLSANVTATPEEWRSGWKSFVEQRARQIRDWQARESRLAKLAIERLRVAAFVGVTDQWQRSVCLFYKAYNMHGAGGQGMGGAAQLGKTRAQDSAQQAQEAAALTTTVRDAGLDGDALDDEVYAFAKLQFEERAARLGCA